MKFENTIIITKPITEVFSYLANLEQLPDWNYAIRRTTKTTPGAVHIGTRYLQERTLPHPMTEELEITAYTPNTLLEFSGGFGPFPLGKSTYHLSPLSDGTQTIIQNEIKLQTRGIPQILASLGSMKIKMAVAQNLEVLKDILEAQ